MTYGNQVAAIAAAGWVHNKQGKGGIEICSVNIGEAKDDLLKASNGVSLVFADSFVGTWLSE